MKDPSCILHRALVQSENMTTPYLPFHLFEMVLTHYLDPLNTFLKVQLFSLIQMEIPDFLLK